MSDSYRVHGSGPVRAVLVHGGPGARGSLRVVAGRLAKQAGYAVLEPDFDADTLAGQVAQLAAACQSCRLGEDAPPVFVGHSWGGWIAIMAATRGQVACAGLVLTGCGPLVEHYAALITPARMHRLGSQSAAEYASLAAQFGKGGFGREQLRRLGELALAADSVDLLGLPDAADTADAEAMSRVMGEGLALRASGGLLDACRELRCPVTVLHGADDPHPVEGVVQPLRECGVMPVVRVFDHCGHYPWLERAAAVAFYNELVASVYCISK